MKANLIRVKPLFTVCYCDYDADSSARTNIYEKDLKEAEIGHVWRAEPDTCCGRAVHDERAKLVYRDEEVAVLLVTTYKTSDSPNPVEWEEKDVAVISFT